MRNILSERQRHLQHLGAIIRQRISLESSVTNLHRASTHTDTSKHATKLLEVLPCAQCSPHPVPGGRCFTTGRTCSSGPCACRQRQSSSQTSQACSISQSSMRVACCSPAEVPMAHVPTGSHSGGQHR